MKNIVVLAALLAVSALTGCSGAGESTAATSTPSVSTSIQYVTVTETKTAAAPDTNTTAATESSETPAITEEPIGTEPAEGEPEENTFTPPVITTATMPAAASAYVMGTALYPAPIVPMPAKGALYTDPDFGTTLRRITDATLDQYQGPGIQNEYSKMDPENCDGTLVILRGNTAAYYLYNATNGECLGEMTEFHANEYNEPEPRWDPADPDVFYYFRNTEFRQYNVVTGVSTLIRDIKKEFPGAVMVTTKSEGDASLDRRYWAMMALDADYTLLGVICYDRATDQIVGQKTGGFPDGLNWVGMSMLGNYVLVGYEDVAIYTDVFSRDFRQLTRLPEGAAGHGDAAITADGREVYICQNVRTDYIAMYDLANGQETPLVELPFGVNPDIGMHISGNCGQTPGWMLVSTYGSMNPPAGSQHSWMDCQLFMVELKASPRVWRIVHTCSYTSQEENGEKNYFAECFASINTAGNRIYYGSNWANYTMDYNETYQVLLPADWVARLPQ